jgi:hypothetical protein
MEEIITGEIPHCDCKRKIAELERMIVLLTKMLEYVMAQPDADCPYIEPCPNHHDCPRCLVDHAKEQARKDLLDEIP